MKTTQKEAFWTQVNMRKTSTCKICLQTFNKRYHW